MSNLKFQITLLCFFALSLLAGCADQPASEPATIAPVAHPSTQPADPAWDHIAAALGRRGELRNDVYTITIPRDDLDIAIEGMDVPTAAGMETTFWFYRCPCGKMNVVGQFILADYEANDVIDALRAGFMKVASVGPVLLYERPRLTLIRFQDEGDETDMAKILREALRWTGKERMAPRPLK
jgi:hypothetical protein